eukprot:CAMPEP_0194386670 /NCGR_PEP_ID=MMETSP0174-20130528/87828_1 /TAXON_ID=216777 /ORGANISM="Proboscia alata, Strain PI-D3" /LENGTH=117 /DNA_ID=CAMNT_0039176109 /DNA_START=1 /DNA_END=351 /DNA_ORIENTATION=-
MVTRSVSNGTPTTTNSDALTAFASSASKTKERTSDDTNDMVVMVRKQQHSFNRQHHLIPRSLHAAVGASATVENSSADSGADATASSSTAAAAATKQSQFNLIALLNDTAVVEAVPF